MLLKQVTRGRFCLGNICKKRMCNVVFIKEKCFIMRSKTVQGPLS